MTVIEPITPPSLALVLVDLANCVCSQLQEIGAGTTCWCGIFPGAEVSWDYCGSCENDRCGMGWVRVVDIFPYEEFPIPSVDIRCALPLAATLEVGALRCLPVEGSGELLDPTSMVNVAIDQALDAVALHNAIKCCSESDLAVGTYLPVGPQGACVGGFWTAYAAL